MQHKARKFFGGFLAIAVGYLALTFISAHLNKNANAAERRENSAWVATSKHWIDRQLCKWVGICGMSHLKSAGWTWDKVDDDVPKTYQNTSDFWTSGPEDPDSWSDEEWMRRKIPQYVFDYAPYVHLFSGERFWPCDLGDHISHMTPYLNYSEITDLKHKINLTNLHELNNYTAGASGRFMYMQSDENVEEWPSWLGGTKNIPNSPQIHRDEDEVVEWPGDDYKDLEAGQAPQQMLGKFGKARTNLDDIYWGLPTLTVSENGRCGGRSGFTCEGSRFGQCCSIYGWCGKGDAYCGDACDPLRGQCNDPFEIRPHPHAELRKRESEPEDTPHKAPPAGKSSAPAILIVVPKEDGIVDAFWFFFYSFNLGQTVLNIRFGNHVGDWEHTLIRFKNGKPIQVFLSEHNFGDAYAWQALEKYVPDPIGEGTMIGTWSNNSATQIAKRPVVYSAVGSHAMYATPGLHPYILPWGMLHDQTDRGPLWDPALNSKSFLYSPSNKTLLPSSRNPRAPTSWFDYAGHWGDKYYALNDPRQYRFAGQYHYVNGPSGPKFKNLARRHVCQGRGKCHIRDWASDVDRARGMPPEEDVEEGGLPGGNITDDSGN